MLLKDLENKKVAIWGLGHEGEAVLHFLQKHMPELVLKVFTNDDEVCFDNVDVIIKSPGVSIYKELLQEAKQKNIEITSSSDLFLNEIRKNHPQCKVIGVSGSKGKSTTSSLLYNALLSLGKNVGFGGNIGKPLIELLEDDYDYIVAEFSSYQAADLTISPHIVLFTNLFPEHIDWHKSHENYYRDKIHLIANQQVNDVAFVNDKCDKLKYYTSQFCNLKYNISDGFYVKDNILCNKEQKLLKISDTKLIGYHNLDNMAGVLSVIDYLGEDINIAINAIKQFEALPHRLQRFATINGVAYVNDSISTAPETAIAAMKSFDENMLVILGGYDRQQNYEELAEYINENNKIKAVIALFQTGPRIANILKEKVKRKDFCLMEETSLFSAINNIYQKIKECDVKLVLFSPAAPSYDSYDNFAKRGDGFMNLVLNQKKGENNAA